MAAPAPTTLMIPVLPSIALSWMSWIDLTAKAVHEDDFYGSQGVGGGMTRKHRHCARQTAQVVALDARHIVILAAGRSPRAAATASGIGFPGAASAGERPAPKLCSAKHA